MSNKNKISPDDLEAFEQAAAGTRRLKHNKIRLTSPRPVMKKRPSANEEDAFDLKEPLALDPVQGEEFIVFKQSGISDKILRNLRKGQYNIEAKLDLHGMTVDKARKSVDHFLLQCLHKQLRVVLIVHGKGRSSQVPILKNKLNHWLRTLPEVLAFCSASSAHGNRGAMYVLLKRHTE